MKIAITGLGVVSCCGNNVNDFWHAVINGHSGLGPLTKFKDDSIHTSLVGEVRNFELGDQFNIRVRSKTDTHIQYALHATEQAVKQSGISFDDPHRIHTVIGTCSGSYNYVGTACKEKPVQPNFLTGHLNNMIASYINMQYGILGAGMALNGACASSSQAIAIGAMLIETGQADVVIVGGTEDWIHPVPIGGLESLRALTYDPVGCRPFDQLRSGFSLSSGAAILILESQESIKKRNANVLAWLAGYAISSDADHPTSPRRDGLATRYMINQSLARANIDSVDYVNAHATGTKIGDLVEASVIDSVFTHKPYISSTKAITGHAVGAVGAMEAIISVKVLEQQLIPATKNLTNSDCPGKHIINESIAEPVNYVMSNSFGFGGTNSALIFSRN